MSTLMLYHLFGISGYCVVGVRAEYSAIILLIVPQRCLFQCSSCRSKHVVSAGTVTRRLRSVPCGNRPVWLEVEIPRLQCADCGVTRQLKLTFADRRVRYTRAFARYVLSLARHMSLRALAALLQVGWDLVKGIVKQHLRHKYTLPRLDRLRRIAIDEIHLGRRAGFYTIVLDLDSGAVVYLGKGRNASALAAFWPRLRASGAKIVAVATDMGQSYHLAVRENIPDAVHVLDRFHVVKLFNHVIDQLRRIELRKARGEQRSALTSTKWILLKRPDRLNPETDQRERLSRALRANWRLMIAYYLKEDLNRFWQQNSREEAQDFLEEWLALADVTGIYELRRFAKTIRRFYDEMLNWYEHKISTGPLESVNGRIRLMQRRAYGYQDEEFLRLRVFALHEQTYA